MYEKNEKTVDFYRRLIVANAEKANVRPTYIDVDAKREKDEEPNVGNDGADKCEKWEFRLNLPYQHKKYPLPHRPKNTATLINGN